MSRSSHNRIERPYPDDRIPTDLFPELSVGYDIGPIDAAIDLSYRPVSSSQSGYGTVQESSRKALSLETINFPADYNGFVPFVGLGIGREWLRFRESDGGTDGRRGRRGSSSGGTSVRRGPSGSCCGRTFGTRRG